MLLELQKGLSRLKIGISNLITRGYLLLTIFAKGLATFHKVTCLLCVPLGEGAVVQIWVGNITNHYFGYYAPPSRPEGPRRCPDRGNAGRGQKTQEA